MTLKIPKFIDPEGNPNANYKILEILPYFVAYDKINNTLTYTPNLGYPYKLDQTLELTDGAYTLQFNFDIYIKRVNQR